MDSVKAQFTLKPDFPFSMFEVREQQTILHSHDCLKINYIQSGSGYYIVEGKSYPIRKGDIFIINNTERHMAIHESSVSMMVLIFDLNLIWEQRNSETYLKPFFKRSITFSNRIEAKDRDARELTDYLHRMEQEYQTRGDG